MKKVIITISDISRIGFGFLTLLEYVFATDNRTMAVLIPFALFVISSIIYKSVK